MPRRPVNILRVRKGGRTALIRLPEKEKLRRAVAKLMKDGKWSFREFFWLEILSVDATCRAFSMPEKMRKPLMDVLENLAKGIDPKTHPEAAKLAIMVCQETVKRWFTPEQLAFHERCLRDILYYQA